MVDQRVIYKYRLPKGGSISFIGPITQIIDIQLQDGSLTAWMENELYKTNEIGELELVKDKDKFWRITFWIIGTGWPYERSAIGKYFRTVQDKDGNVWHIFIQKEKITDVDNS